jgi:hypothetical protein
MKNHKAYLILIAFVLTTSFSFVDNEMINQIVEKLINYSNRNYQEKVYVHTDTDIYYAGDIIWLNARLLDAQAHTPSRLSKVVHLKLYNSQDKELYHKKIKTEGGMGNADILLSDTLSTGSYQIIGYTEWMKNFSPEFFYQKSIYIVNDKPVLDGSIVSDEKALNVQFFPEGGTFISEMNNRLGFEATDVHGKGVDLKGFILDDKGDTVINVSTYKYGIGSFNITPVKNRSYTLFLRLNESLREFPLPASQEEGINLTVETHATENIQLELEASRKFIAQNKRLYLIVHNRGQVNFAAEGGTSKKYQVNIPKSRLAAGINQVTVFGDNGMPLVERLVFIQPADEPILDISGIKANYATREMVRVDLTSAISEDASVTVSVHDRPSIGTANIENHLLLTSDLKGLIEDPEYYFKMTDSAVIAADNLMLTHGWRRFVWSDVLSDERSIFEFPAERDGLTFRGKLIDNHSGMPLIDTTLLLSFLNQSPNYLTTYSDSEGELACVLHEMYGSKKIFVNIPGVRESNDFRLIHANNYDSFDYPFERQKITLFQRDLSAHINARKKEQLILENYRIYKPDLYSPPVFTSKEDVFGYNQKLHYPNREIYTDDYVPLANFKEMVFELIPSAKFKKHNGAEQLFVLDETTQTSVRSGIAYDHSVYALNKKPATIFVNGIPVFDQESAFNIPYNDIHKVEVYNRKKYNNSGYTFHGVVSITTKDFLSGQGSGLEQTSNALEIDGYALKREFYSPISGEEYMPNRLPDIRHLIFWQPNTVVSPGDATTLTFNTSDIKGDFTVSVEGVSATGKPIYLTQQFTVK